MPKIGVRAAGYRARQSPTTQKEDSLKLAVAEASTQSITQHQRHKKYHAAEYYFFHIATGELIVNPFIT